MLAPGALPCHISTDALLPAALAAHGATGIGTMDDHGLAKDHRDYWDRAGFLAQIGIGSAASSRSTPTFPRSSGW
jgi:hypothetical protein